MGAGSLDRPACHELRSPLTALRGEIELALRRQRRPEEYRRVPKSNLEEVARGIVDRFRGAAADRDVDLSLRVEGDGVTSVDPGLLGQVICPSPSTASMPLAPHERGEEDEHGGAQARSHEARPKVAYGVNGG